MKKLRSIKYKSLMAAIAVGSLLSSCEKHIKIDEPADRLLTSVVFSDSSTAESAVVGIYLQQNTFITAGFYSVLGSLSGYVTLLPGLSADELRTVSIGSYHAFFQNEIPENNADNYTNWSSAYNIIYHANAVIENLENSTSLSSGLKQRLGAEAKFMRALNFFYLTCEYGNVPLTLTTNYKTNAALDRSDTGAVLTKVQQDLEEAKQFLPATYPGSGEKIRANKYSAIALLARVHLYRKNYVEAEQHADIVINEGGYSIASVSETFIPNNQESILQFAPTTSFSWNTPEGGLFLQSNEYALTEELLQSFEINDLRKDQWTRTFTVNGSTFYSPYKYKYYYKMAGKEYNVVLRLSEQYLIRAEARAQMEKIDDAINDLDMVRDRASLPLVADNQPGITKDELLDAILHERQIEFFAEWGHRWFDLKRLNMADAVLQPIKGAQWQPTDMLYPIPQQEILDNPALEQNDGYKR